MLKSPTLKTAKAYSVIILSDTTSQVRLKMQPCNLNCYKFLGLEISKPCYPCTCNIIISYSKALYHYSLKTPRNVGGRTQKHTLG